MYNDHTSAVSSQPRAITQALARIIKRYLPPENSCRLISQQSLMHLTNEQTRTETPTFGGGEHQDTPTLNSDLLSPNFQTLRSHDFRGFPDSRSGPNSDHDLQFVPRNACSASWLCGGLSCKQVRDRISEAEPYLHEAERFMLTTYTRGENSSIDYSAGFTGLLQFKFKKNR